MFIQFIERVEEKRSNARLAEDFISFSQRVYEQNATWILQLLKDSICNFKNLYYALVNGVVFPLVFHALYKLLNIHVGTTSFTHTCSSRERKKNEQAHAGRTSIRDIIAMLK